MKWPRPGLSEVDNMSALGRKIKRKVGLVALVLPGMLRYCPAKPRHTAV
jgi:hypothetical protein